MYVFFVFVLDLTNLDLRSSLLLTAVAIVPLMLMNLYFLGLLVELFVNFVSTARLGYLWSIPAFLTSP